MRNRRATALFDMGGSSEARSGLRCPCSWKYRVPHRLHRLPQHGCTPRYSPVTALSVRARNCPEKWRDGFRRGAAAQRVGGAGRSTRLLPRRRTCTIKVYRHRFKRSLVVESAVTENAARAAWCEAVKFIASFGVAHQFRCRGVKDGSACETLTTPQSESVDSGNAESAGMEVPRALIFASKLLRLRAPQRNPRQLRQWTNATAGVGVPCEYCADWPPQPLTAAPFERFSILMRSGRARPACDGEPRNRSHRSPASSGPKWRVPALRRLPPPS